MRFHLLGLVLLAGVAMPAPAQRTQPLDRRVDRIEQELRAVQRRVFPNGNAQFVEPEIGAQPNAGPGGSLSGDALSVRGGFPATQEKSDKDRKNGQDSRTL